MKINWKLGVGVVAGILLWWLFIDWSDKKKEIKGLKDEIAHRDEIDDQIKIKLSSFVENNNSVGENIKNELASVVALIGMKHESKAILSLTKIIENLLKEIYSKSNENLLEICKKNNRKKPAFADYLELSKQQKIISKEDFHLISVAKLIRDKEAHELNVKSEKSRVVAAFVSGFDTILKLCNHRNKIKLIN